MRKKLQAVMEKPFHFKLCVTWLRQRLPVPSCNSADIKECWVPAILGQYKVSLACQEVGKHPIQ